MTGRRLRRFLCGVTIAITSAASLSACGDEGGAAERNEIVFNSWGGDFQKAQSEVIFAPFETESKIKVVQLSDGENIYAKVKSQAGQDIGEIDMVHGDASWLMRGRQDNLWAKIDYSELSAVNIYDDARDDYGVGVLYWSFNIVYNPAKFTEAPTTWADVWDYAKQHPKRVAMWSARPNYVIEAALMADGTRPDGVYPLTGEKIDRAYAKLDEIKDKVAWFEGGAQGGRLFEEGQVDIGMFYGGDAFSLKVDGAAPTVVWNQGLYTRDYWLIPANAPHKEQALQLLKFALQPQRQAELADRTGYGPVAPEAVAQLDPAVQAKLTSVEPQKSSQLSYDYEWWGENDDAQLQRWTTWLRG
ncbi:ABC transporter substrate-binding protein [Micromonospora sp. C95]|uniref:ABC transporter substrate-binding protein n=1 Tax=Micromonospora sp. C95 TaxID=2824882 RepID=UPI001B35B89D|nr:ABC transporter substrate-binding protein [Micromonospora sp. C95]MBQ1026016.1 ABC transporter substrate-binding protein [Micromonospora sp. C95]